MSEQHVHAQAEMWTRDGEWQLLVAAPWPVVSAGESGYSFVLGTKRRAEGPKPRVGLMKFGARDA